MKKKRKKKKQKKASKVVYSRVWTRRERQTFGDAQVGVVSGLTGEAVVSVVFDAKTPCCDVQLGVIHLPPLPLHMNWTLAEMIRGYVDHETGHIRYTDPTMEAPRSIESKHPLLGQIYGVVEDARVNGLMGEVGEGCYWNIRYMTQEIGEQILKDDEMPPAAKVGVALMFEMMDLPWKTQLGRFERVERVRTRQMFAEEPLGSVTPMHGGEWERRETEGDKLVRKMMKEIGPLLKLTELENTKDALGLAKDIEKEWKKLLPPDSPAPPDQSKEEDSGSGKGEDGKGEGGSVDDELMQKIVDGVGDDSGGHTNQSEKERKESEEELSKPPEISLTEYLKQVKSGEKKWNPSDHSARMIRQMLDWSNTGGVRDLIPFKDLDRKIRLSSSPGNEKRYRIIKEELDRRIAPIRQRMLLDLLSKKKLWSRDKEEGSLDDRSLFRVPLNDKRVFKKREKREGLNTVFGMLVDCSSSMSRERIRKAVELVIAMSEILEPIHVPFEVWGFNHRSRSDGNSIMARGYTRASPLTMYQVKLFGETLRERAGAIASLMDRAAETTPLGEPIMYVGERLLERYERRKVLLVVTDGLPMANHEWGGVSEQQVIEEHTKKVISRLTREGVEVFGAAIGSDHRVEDFFPKWVKYNEADKLLSDFYPKLSKLLKGEDISQKKKVAWNDV